MDNLIHNLDFEALKVTLTELGQPDYRSQQIWDGLYVQLYTDFEQFSNIPKSLREDLATRFVIDPLKEQKSIVSKDGLTEKILFGLQDGLSIETVLMRYEERNSLAYPTQVGCLWVVFLCYRADGV